jgi:hypothetical protein
VPTFSVSAVQAVPEDGGTAFLRNVGNY